MSIHLQRDLEALEQNLLTQSSMVEQMVFRAVQSLRELRVEIAQEVIASEETINYREVEIEEECLKILALHQPVAVDLRRVATVLKINGDLERIADLAVNISERTHSLVLHPEFQHAGASRSNGRGRFGDGSRLARRLRAARRHRRPRGVPTGRCGR